MSNLDTMLQLTILDDIGGVEGKNSTVKLAHDRQLNSNFAVKIVPKIDFVEEFGDDSNNMFFEEAKMIYRNQHPNIVKIQHATSCEDNVYYTMPFYEKGSLNKVMNNKSLTIREIIKVSLEFLSGIHFIHTNGLIHFDVKPTNILINSNGKAMLTDFGLSRYTNDYGVAKFSKVYTSHYPPECIGSNAMTKQADVYMAGMTLYRMCNGDIDFKHQYEEWKKQGRDKFYNAIRKGKFPARTYLPHIPRRLRTIINKALKPNPDERYKTIIDMMNDVSKISKNLDIRFYLEDAKTLVWEKPTSETHYAKIKLVLEDNCKTIGKKINSINGTETNISKMNKNGYKDTKEAFKCVEDYIKD